jgi:hypothetical protein
VGGLSLVERFVRVEQLVEPGGFLQHARHE